RGCALLTVEENTNLREVARILPKDRESLVLVTDDSGVVLGVVSSNEVRSPREYGHEQERSRWQQMPIGALMPVRMPSVFRSIGGTQQLPDCNWREDIRGVSAFVADGEVFVNWRSLAPELREAFRDRLTGLPNRAGLELRLKQDWLRAQTGNEPLALLIIDLDHFKEVNDTLGHLFGDGLLQEVARAMKERVRSYDVVTRYGGDEFVAICVGCSAEEIALPVARICDALHDISFDTACDLSVSASIGAAICNPGVNCHSESDLLGAADECLYAAKRHMRGSTFCVDLTAAGKTKRSPQLLLSPVAR
ncbi:MAG: diguanylate cyclase, partial [Planctomycetaceae bacterium]